jgi:peptide/nickel transport system permease protein
MSFLWKSVLSVIAACLPVTLLIGFVSFSLELLLASARGYGRVPVRIAWRTADHRVSLVMVSLPPFLTALLLQKWLVIDLHLFPLSGIATAGGMFSVSDLLLHIALPCLTLALLDAGRLSRYVRVSAAAVLAADFIPAARAGGLTEPRILFGYVLRNALIPVITYIGLSLPVLFGGAIVIETLFGLPGIGLLSYQAVLSRDYPLLLGITSLVCLVTVAGNTLADVLYAAADPRIRVGGIVS